MNSTAFLMLALAPQTAVEAEREFAAMAQVKGQNAAFRAYAGPEALMFVPKATSAHEFLKDQKDPPWNLMWWPARSWTACDASLAINTGPAYRGGAKNNGNFTTLWKRQADGGWKWLLDQGWPSPRRTPATEQPQVRKPMCRNLARARAVAAKLDPRAVSPHVTVHVPGQAPSSTIPSGSFTDGSLIIAGTSRDGSFAWEVRNLNGAAEGAHILRAWQWDGNAHRLVFVEYAGLHSK